MRHLITKYTARWADGYEISKTSEEFKSRLDFYNWICRNALGKGHKGLIEITATPYPA